MKINFKYRIWNFITKPPLRKIKLEIPGWGGKKTFIDGQPHHCKPFIDGSTYGYEILYPFDTEIRVRCDGDDGKCQFLTESKDEWKNSPNGIPMANFAPFHFGFTSSLDIKTEEGWGVMILPHPRFYVDRTGCVPCPSIGLLETGWWPNVFFIPFKAPMKGHDYVFRKGEGIAHIIFVPKEVEYNCQRMTKEEEDKRLRCEAAIRECSDKISTKQWKDQYGHKFDNKYKILSQMAKKLGDQAVEDYLVNLINKTEIEKKQKLEEIRRNTKYRFVKPNDNKI